jgi:hypothetical protein
MRNRNFFIDCGLHKGRTAGSKTAIGPLLCTAASLLKGYGGDGGWQEPNHMTARKPGPLLNTH